MAIIALPGFPDKQIAPEYCVGAAYDTFVYPGIQQCLTLTGFHVAGMLGTHISPGITAQELAKTFEILRAGGGGQYLSWYLVGMFDEHFKHSKVGWNSTKNIAKTLRKELRKTANFYAYDTTQAAKDNNWTWGVSVYAKKKTFEVEVSYAKSGGQANVAKPDNAIVIDDKEFATL